MPQFKIVFSGLMCHIDVDKNTKRAVIVRDGNHEPVIWARNVRASRFVELDTIEGWRRFRIPSDAQIHINGLVKQEIGPISDLDVPNLKRFIPHFDPLNEILSSQKHNAVRGYVEYTGGTFSATSYFPSAASFNDVDYYCSARELVLTTASLETVKEVEIVDLESGRALTVEPNATVAFTQLDKKYNNADYKLYRNLSKTAVGVFGMTKRPEPPCIDSGRILPKAAFIYTDVTMMSVDVECTSSHWP